MSLVDFIKNGNYASSQEAHEALVTPVQTSSDKAWTVDDIARLFPNDVNIILGTLKSVPVFESAFIALSITGLELASDARQAFIDQVAEIGSWSEELTTQIKQLGRPLIAPWQSMGLSQEPTLAEVAKALLVIEARRQMAAILQPVQAKSTAVNGWLDALDTSGMTVAEVEAYCSELLASPDGNPSEVV